MRPSRLIFTGTLPNLDFENSLLIYDRRLRKQWGAWIGRFPNSYAVTSGEKLKDLAFFPEHAQKMMHQCRGLSPARLRVVAFGGGSVGDFAGFFASVFKRGVGLVQIPSTWLAAMDSAHGGKTALNLGLLKNQIGSFYPAQQIYLVRGVLTGLGEERFREALPEAFKVALLQGTSLTAKVEAVRQADSLWPLLPALIRAKIKIVRQDPFEKKGVRHLLNLGHTLGHVIEARTGLAHGLAVGLGTRFALEWSAERGYGSLSRVRQSTVLPSRTELARVLRRLKNPGAAFAQDKKIGKGGGVRFVFLREPGRPLIREVSIADLINEIRRQAR